MNGKKLTDFVELCDQFNEAAKMYRRLKNVLKIYSMFDRLMFNYYRLFNASERRASKTLSTCYCNVMSYLRLYYPFDTETFSRIESKYARQN